MAKDTPSMVKNKIRRSLGSILDRHPSKNEKSMFWEYFEHRCVYCGLLMEKESREGHLDHVVATSKGGNNSIYNHVLSCKKCNGDEKREMDWRSFMRLKSNSDQKFESRQNMVDLWLKKNSVLAIDPVIDKEAEAIIADAIKDFDKSVERMRSLKKSIV